MTQILQYLGAALLLVGAVFSLLAALGVLRLPDLYTRLHAASKAGVVGAGFMLVGAGIVSGDGAIVLRALLGMVFLLLATPISAHLLARAALRAGISPDSRINTDVRIDTPPNT
jgi:multicomponent Na+:H+ antiporter subunit G